METPKSLEPIFQIFCVYVYFLSSEDPLKGPENIISVEYE